ncbi:hypothetical protein [Thalassoglobus polymorphus]|uniref:Uncharacterized protein n=1 Tax=Thalassoglobus polymorphus TaxID=2527994 RepID=A0A517QN84_9PLAN|nr:hypothetical protein [Thalassoglobus polymorphus]QDT33065.1 hypothetical protein Mal48_23170 [Thalassoglobus polymorphus]
MGITERNPNTKQDLLIILLFFVAVFSNATLGWVSLQLIFLLTVFKKEMRSIESHNGSSHVNWVVPSILLGSGFWIGLSSEDAFLHQVGVIGCLTGIGGMLGWFPVPRATTLFSNEDSIASLVTGTLLPVLCAAIFLFRCVEDGGWSERDLAILGVVSLFSLAISGLRLMGPLSPQQRCRLSILTILSQANIVSVLLGWQKIFPERNGSASSNIISSENLFLTILIVETSAVLLLIWSCRSDSNDQTQGFRSTLFRKLRPVLPNGSLPAIAGVLTLSGFPLFPGSWWRFKLLTALILPYEQSMITQLSEPHLGFVALALGYAACSLIVAIGQLRILPTLLEREEIPSLEPSLNRSHG